MAMVHTFCTGAGTMKDGNWGVTGKRNPAGGATASRKTPPTSRARTKLDVSIDILYSYYQKLSKKYI